MTFLLAAPLVLSRNTALWVISLECSTWKAGPNSFTYNILSKTKRVMVQVFLEDSLGIQKQITAVEQLATFIKITWTNKEQRHL